MCSMELAEAEEWLVRFRAAADQPMEQAVVTGWEAEAKALRQQVVELLGQQKTFGVHPCCRPIRVQSSVEAEKVVQEWAAKRRACGE